MEAYDDRVYIDAIHHVFKEPDSAWKLLDSRANVLYYNETKVAKFAKDNDPERLTNGLLVSECAHAMGIKAVKPLIGHVVLTPAGPATFWPRIIHKNIDCDTLDNQNAFLLGKEFSKMSGLNFGQSKAWAPFRQSTRRFEKSDFAKSIISDIAILLEKISSKVPPAILETPNLTFAHGDAYLGNVLINEDIHLIDFDSADWYPRNWDLASMYNHLVLEGGNASAFDAFFKGWKSNNKTVNWEELSMLSLIKVMSRTTFALILEPTEERVNALKERIVITQEWVETLSVPKHLPRFV